ncbi:hypothetical protein BC829DRAFT_409363 [Chytridium lagenaria]|nr:hypothetical protein BC829DRAFT_409363 [Chytridium lagenaria]
MQYDNPSPPEHKKLNRYRIAQGFRLCTMLEGSTFDAFEPVEAWNWDRAVDRRKPMEALVELVDNVAENIMTTALQALKETAENADIKNKMLRLSCYAAADGSNSLARLSQRPLLRKNSASTISSKSYKVAYLLQVEVGDTLRIPNVKHLIDLLDDGSSLILIHVDADAPLIRSELGAFIFKRLEDIEIDRSGPRTLADVGNVFLAKNRFSKRRSGSGMLWSMLSGMWELMDLGTGWSHVINISPLDIPVRKAGEVQRVLGLKRNAKKSFVSIEDPAEAADFWAINSAQSYLSAVRREGVSDNITQSDVKNISTPRSLKRLMEPMILYSPFQNWNVCKQSPWMILSRESLDFLRSSWTSHRVMAFMEHMKRAEEKFFCYGGLYLHQSLLKKF